MRRLTNALAIQFGSYAIIVTVVVTAGLSQVSADEDDTSPGLHGTVSGGENSVTRTDHRLNFDWTDSQIESRVADVQSVRWSGNLLVRTGGRHTFHAQISGAVKILVDNVEVLAVHGANVFRSGESVDLSAGDHQIQVEFETNLQQPDAKPPSDFKLQLFWSSPDFTLEPIPADALTHVPEHSNAIASTIVARQGRALVDAMRCAACHTGLDELQTLKAPDLQRLRGLTSDTDIVRRLAHPETMGAWNSMPDFNFSEAEAQDVAAFLLQVSEAKDLPKDKIASFKDGDVDAGQKLLLTTGCVACHAMAQMPAGFEPQAAPYHGPDLTNVKDRRDVGWLVTWLKSPKSINPQHRMPVFALTEDEQRQIVAALSQQTTNHTASPPATGPEKIDTDASAIARGRELVIKANCSSCHKISGIESTKASRLRPLASSSDNNGHNCIAAEPQETDLPKINLPHFRLNDVQRNQIEVWLSTLSANLPTAGGFVRGELLLRRNGCLACHDRDQQSGISRLTAAIESKRDDLRGQSQALIPPPLTAVGDRLQDDYLQHAVAGEQKVRRLPWLLVRMPRFEMSPDDRQSIVRYFVGSDRIPESADVARPELFTHLDPLHPTIATANELLLGNQLVGAGGFNCIACHKAGTFEPRNVAMGTRGSDIMTMGQRVRSRYFMRWMQNPIRVVPGIEMPAIRKPVAGVLEDSLSQQISVLWKALADPKFSPPTVVSRFEQFVTLSLGDRPRVIRDVFTVRDGNSSSNVARAFAVGFDNGHNLLLDLDSMQLRQWTIGEFARQRTEGKSWFWDMAGVELLQTNEDRPFATLVKIAEPDSKVIRPVIDQRRQGELLSYRVDGDSVTLRVRFHFDPQHIDGSTDLKLPAHSPITAWNNPDRSLVQVIVKFVFKPVPSDNDQTGWTWNVVLEDCPQPFALQLSPQATEKSHGEIPWTVTLNSPNSEPTQKNSPQLSEGESATWQYVCDVRPTMLVPPAVVQSSSVADAITAVPGFHGERLPISTAIMPTGIAWLADGRMVMTSLKGDVWIVSDTNKDRLPDSTKLFADGLSAPYGIQVDGDSILVAHKPEVLRLRDSDGDGRADQLDVVASGWGCSDDYHDWTTALVRDRNGDLFVGLGSDYSQNKRPADNDRWRGTILKIDSNGTVSPVATAFRFPMGLAFDRNQNLFATDNQGVQNTFNEINHVIIGKHYGVPSRHEEATDMPPETPAVMVPHPWTRSVNSILFLPDDFANPDLAGHGIGCEYDTRCLIRFTIQEVEGVQQGACYRLSQPDLPGGGGNFVGPVASAIGPDGALYIGSIWDSGWQGGSNTGSIERLVPDQMMPNGIREIRATATGFDVVFFRPFKNAALLTDIANWSIQGYTRHWSGSYATPDSERYTIVPENITLSADGKTAMINAKPIKAGFLYEIGINDVVSTAESLWPAEGFYSMKVVPKPYAP